MQNKEKFLEVSHVSKVFPVKKQQLHAVSDVNFSISRGEILGIVGESGCGKSTLAKMLVGSLPVSEGKMILNGEDYTELTGRKKGNFAGIFRWYFRTL